MSKPIPLFILAVMLWLTGTAAHAANVKAWLDRPVIEWGETVTLNIESDDTSGGQPDLSALRGDFDIVQQSSSSQTTISNGKRSSTMIWAVAIKAKAAGIFTIPAISIQGTQTAPLTLRVNQPKPVSQNEAAHAGEDIFLLASVDDDQPYVQQNVLYTIKLYHKVNLYNGNISLPNNAPNQQAGQNVQQVGKDMRYTTQVGNDIYRVIERRFAFQFNQSGSQTLAPSVLEGQMASNQRSRFGRNFGGKRVVKRSPSVTLNVRPMPASAKQPFLPATSMQLMLDSGNMPTSVTVGEPLSINLRLRAEGLSADQLPALTLPNITQASVYPDKPVRQDLKANDRLTSRISRGFAIVPSQAGTLVIPPVRIAWWNTTTNQAETASWPGASIRVLPADQTANTAQNASNNPSTNQASANPTTRADGALIASNTPNNDTPKPMWKYLALLGFGLWLITSLLWWRQSARAKRQANINRPIQPTAPPSNPKELNRLLRDNPSPAAITQALIRLANQQKSGALSLQDVCDRLSSTEQQAAVLALDKHRFAADVRPSDWADTLDVIRQAFAKPPEWRSEESAADNALPELYPSK